MDIKIITNPFGIMALALLWGIITYSVHWVCSSLYDAGYDIFNIFKKKKKSRKRS